MSSDEVVVRVIQAGPERRVSNEDQILLVLGLVLFATLLVLQRADAASVALWSTVAAVIGTIFGVALAFRLERGIESRRALEMRKQRARDRAAVQRAVVASVAHNVRVLEKWLDGKTDGIIPCDLRTWSSLQNRYAELSDNIGPLLRFSAFFSNLDDYDLLLRQLTDANIAATVAGREKESQSLIVPMRKVAQVHAKRIVNKGKKIILDLGEVDQIAKFSAPQTDEEKAFALEIIHD